MLVLTEPSLGSTCLSGEMVCTSELCPGTPPHAVVSAQRLWETVDPSEIASGGVPRKSGSG